MTSSLAERGQWTGAGADVAAQNTYASVKTALAGLHARHPLEIFLQGSYANQTNIRDDSDVDIVVMSKEVFIGSTDRLNLSTRQQYDNLGSGSYSAAQLRSDVTAALNDYYGSFRVHPRNKCIQVDKAPGYVDADVVPCLKYEWYRTPDSIFDYVEGIIIFPQRGGRIVNFPKEHIKNGQAKNQRTRTYKATVRQMKRLRNRAVAEGRIAHGIAPGYLLECMTYNAPDSKFILNDSDRLRDVLLWLKYADKTSFKSCDEIHLLFKTDPGRFEVGTAQRIIDALWEAF